MKRIDNRNIDHNNIRVQSTNCEDRIKLISYPTFLLITWHIVTSTRDFLEQILQEEFDDLLCRIILYRSNNQQQKIDFQINELSGILRLDRLSTGTYYCELDIRNSQNEAITVKRSEPLFYLQEVHNIENKYQWKPTSLDQQSWIHAFSGYTIYE